MASSCSPATFGGLNLYGGEIMSTQANLVNNYSFDIPSGWRYSQPSENVQNASFCNVTLTYTHPGRNDTINDEIWLPVDNYNGRLQAVGGGGWVAGRFILTYAGMAGAVYDGYATATTDAGVPDGEMSPVNWGLTSVGNLNLVGFDNFGQTALDDLAVLSKQVIQKYYGKEPEYSYWNGCSNGGRQSSILAQQYPTAYNGIIAAAPGLYWPELCMSSAWAPFYMQSTQQFPLNCEMDEITTRAISICDGLDGVKDGIISNPEACRAKIDADDFVGIEFACWSSGKNMTISKAAANVAETVWTGPTYSNGDFMWYGFEIGANLSTIAATTCINGTCSAADESSVLFLYNMFVLRDPMANTTSLTHKQYDTTFLATKKQLATIAATEARINDFKDAGGKMITYHGLVDGAITPASSLHYYQEVSKVMENVTDFYRYFRTPGLEHCWGGNGGQPIQLFDQLRAWVENGTAPDSTAVQVSLPNNTTAEQILCPYPKQAVMEQPCANTTSSECWACV